MTRQANKSGLSARNLVGIALIGIVLAVLPFVLGMAGQSWVRILNFALLYVMLALGLNIVVGFAGLLDLGYIAFYAVGAYTWALLASPHFGLHLPFWAILPIALGVACVFGVLLGAPTLKLRGDYLAIVTLGFGEIIRIFLNNLNAPVNITNGPQGINRIDAFKVGDFCVRTYRDHPGHPLHGAGEVLLPAGAADAADRRGVRAAAEFAHRTRLGSHPRRRDRGQGHGHQQPQHRTAGLRHGRFCSAEWPARCSPPCRASSAPRASSLTESISVLCMVVLGGMGHIPGVILGAVILAVLPEFLRAGGRAPRSTCCSAPWCSIRKAYACCCSAWRWCASCCSVRPACGPPRCASANRAARAREVPHEPHPARPGLGKRFGGLRALSEVSFDIEAGEIYGLIGPNGAGKTTLFNALTGLYVPEEGQCEFNGMSLIGRKPHEVAAAGLARTFRTSACSPT